MKRTYDRRLFLAGCQPFKCQENHMWLAPLRGCIPEFPGMLPSANRKVWVGKEAIRRGRRVGGRDEKLD